MKRLAFVLAAAFMMGMPSAAGAQGLHQGDDDIWSIDQYTATYHIHADGSTDVTIDFLFNFGTQPGHGPYVTYVTRQPYDDTTDRLYPISDVRASSPTGAPDGVYLDEVDGWLKIRIGDEDIDDVMGVQEYVLTYAIAGTLNETTASELDSNVAPADDTPLFDEFVWNPIGDGWEIPLDDITIVVKGDAGAIDVRCFAGEYGSTDGCTSEALAEGVATFTQDHLDPYQGMTVAVAFPPGSFDTAPILEPMTYPDRPTGDVAPEDESVAPVATYVAIGAGFLALAAVGVALGVRGRGRRTADGTYPGLAPGLTPDDRQSGTQGDGFL